MKKILLSIIYIIFSINFLSYSQQTQSPLVKSFEEYKKLKEKSIINLDWVFARPSCKFCRVESIQVDEKNPGTMYVAFGSGNLWKTTNNGISWKPLLNDIPSIGIVSILQLHLQIKK